jgi:RNA polymerase sigma-70 factor (ECF subfamily)
MSLCLVRLQSCRIVTGCTGAHSHELDWYRALRLDRSTRFYQQWSSPALVICVIGNSISSATNGKMLSENRTEDDKILIRLIVAGDQAAFARLYDRLGNVLYALACRLLNDAKEAEDLLQEVFTHIWTKASQYNPEKGTLFSWSVTILRSRAIDRIRKRNLSGSVLAGADPFAVAEQVVDNESANEPLFRERRKMIREAISKLPAEQREVIELAFFEGLTHQDVAVRLSLPLGTIKARIRRGLLRLRDQLKEVL